MGTIINNNFFKIKDGVYRYVEPVISSGGVVLSYTISELITTPGGGVWTKPDGVTSLTVECWGAGGGGGGSSVNGAGGGGGGGGGYARSALTYSSAQQFISYNVGDPGPADTSGGPSTWQTNVVVGIGGGPGNVAVDINTQAQGGDGGGLFGSNTGDITYQGGNGLSGWGSGISTVQFGFSSGGGSAGSTGPGGSGDQLNTLGGTGTSEFGGNGGDGTTSANNFTGLPGSIYGGGGSGAQKISGAAKIGGAGAQGLIRVSYSVPPPLDAYTGSSAAFSVRKLTDSATYCMQVRRSNDNATQDIGFQSDGLIDTGSLLSFVGSNTGYVNIWYNQADIQTDFFTYSGSAIVPIATTIEAPYIVNAGSLVTQNGKPAVFYNALAGLYAETVLTNASGLWATFAVAQVADTTTRLLVRTVNAGTNIAQNIRRNTTNIESIGFNNVGGTGTDLGPSNPGTAQFIVYAQRTSANVEVFINGATNGATAVAGTPAVSNVRGVGSQIHIGFFGGSGPPTFPWSGTIQEVIHYPQDPATFDYRVAVTAALNSFYGTF